MPNHDISLTAASEKTANFRGEYITVNTIRFLIPKSEVLAILNQQDCYGLACYLALDDPDEPDELQLVFVGATTERNDMTSGVLKNSTFGCPPNCSEANELNGL